MIMRDLLKTKVGRLRIVAFWEGLSLILLLFVATPMKYFLDNSSMTKKIGPIHGVLLLLFIVQTLSLAIQQRWSFRTRTWKVILASFIPFGTFYIDKTILSKL